MEQREFDRQNSCVQIRENVPGRTLGKSPGDIIGTTTATPAGLVLSLEVSGIATI